MIALIFSRLGNFPAENKFLSETHVNILHELPKSLWIEREHHFVSNTIKLDKREITLTDFQIKLWDACSKFDVVIVNASTSAGKSFILQNHIVDRILQFKSKNILYIVPSRALIEQVIVDIKKIIITSDIHNVLITEIPSVENLDENNIFVLTQERVQLLLENEINIDLVIIDEAQNISDLSRGILLQSAIEKIRDLNVLAKFIFATPFVKNPDIFLSVFNLHKKHFKIVFPEDATVLQNIYNVVVDKKNNNSVDIYKLLENGIFSKIGKHNSKYKNSNENKYLATLPLTFSNNENSIIYASEPSKCEKIALLIIQGFNDEKATIDDELLDFSNYIKENIHENFSLAETIQHGVAFHYGKFPSFIRKGIERLCVKGKIKYLVCTSTMLQGVNLPVKNIFMMKPSKGRVQKTQKTIPLTSSEFWNLAGRAGRLTKDFEGNVFLINLKEWDYDPLSDDNKLQNIVPAFTQNIQDIKKLCAFVEDRNHASGERGSQGVENTFMKLVMLETQGQLETVLDNIMNFSSDGKDDIVRSIKNVVKSVNLPYEIYSKNPCISIFRQQELFDYFSEKSKNEGFDYFIPPHPKHAFNTIKGDYIKIFSRIDKIFSKKNNRSYVYFSQLALLWMRGMSYSELLKRKIEYKAKNMSRNPNINTEARNLFDEIEDSIRFKYVKFCKCYLDILIYFLQENNELNILKSIPPIHLFLELGASSSTMINLIGIGFSRTSASYMSSIMLDDSMDRNSIYAWFKKIILNYLIFQIVLYLKSNKFFNSIY